jgi:hypothetical protein
VTQWVRGFVSHLKCATVQIHHLSREPAAFSKQKSTTTFLTRPTTQPGSCPLELLCLLPRHDNDPGGNPPTLPRFYLAKLKRLWLAVDEVIHHDDVVVLIIVPARLRVAGRDPHACDQRLIEHDSEKGKACVPWRSRDETAEQ